MCQVTHMPEWKSVRDIRQIADVEEIYKYDGMLASHVEDMRGNLTKLDGSASDCEIGNAIYHAGRAGEDRGRALELLKRSRNLPAGVRGALETELQDTYNYLSFSDRLGESCDCKRRTR